MTIKAIIIKIDLFC